MSPAAPLAVPVPVRYGGLCSCRCTLCCRDRSSRENRSAGTHPVARLSPWRSWGPQKGTPLHVHESHPSRTTSGGGSASASWHLAPFQCRHVGHPTRTASSTPSRFRSAVRTSCSSSCVIDRVQVTLRRVAGFRFGRARYDLRAGELLFHHRDELVAQELLVGRRADLLR